ncbi:hypothetical protein PHAMO_200051 [Magnetospirillum molischianum DSM 120]|uniref:Uncharacterized protein n=1 Tax=Magnetospirillum molischianum DSM 120 TaxID=1150626 RepID=H8FQ28_MAGML|nr:hypothetical protein PHAMO_200051 [Magnetospirillum molischianum DSM 120]
MRAPPHHHSDALIPMSFCYIQNDRGFRVPYSVGFLLRWSDAEGFSSLIVWSLCSIELIFLIYFNILVRFPRGRKSQLKVYKSHIGKFLLGEWLLQAFCRSLRPLIKILSWTNSIDSHRGQCNITQR